MKDTVPGRQVGDKNFGAERLAAFWGYRQGRWQRKRKENRRVGPKAIHALIAPRPHLELSGDQDGGAPADGIEVLEKKLGALSRLYGKGDHFRSVMYKNTGHEYLPEMRSEMVEWFERHLPVKK